MNVAIRPEPHYRLTPDQVKTNYMDGQYTAYGYLNHLLRAMKAEGWRINIDSVSDFCDEWGISQSSFYKAKARLINAGLMSEEIQGRLILKMEPSTLKSESDFLKSESDFLKSESDFLKSESDFLKSEKIDPQNPIENSGFSDSPDLIQISINSYSDLSQLDRGKKTEKAQIAKRDRSAYSDQFEKWWCEYRDFCTCVNAKPGSKKEAWGEWLKNESFFSGQHFQDCDQIYRRREIARLAAEGRVYGIKHGCRYLRSDEWENAFYAARRSAEMGIDFSDPAAVRQAADAAARQKSRDRLMELAKERGYA